VCNPKGVVNFCEYRTDEQGNVSSAKLIMNLEGDTVFVFIQIWLRGTHVSIFKSNRHSSLELNSPALYGVGGDKR
jgi:uncharacterized membrane protein YhfC